jgi:hypothetical protein
MNRKVTIKQQKGITLVALITTIIVLLILAGVSINGIIGDSGLITQAQWGKFSSEMQNIAEQVHTEQLREAASGLRIARKIFN